MKKQITPNPKQRNTELGNLNSELPLSGNVALVTGAAKRVGKAIACELAKNGCNIALHYNTSRNDAMKTKKEIEENYGVDVFPVRANLSKPKEISAMVKKVHLHFKRIDILVNSASIFIRTPFEKINERDFDAHISVNLKAPYLLCKLCSDIMLKQKNGHIINISDWAGFRPYKNYLPYCISKAGVIALTHALAKELAPHIQVNSVAPGPVLLPENFTAAEKQKIIKKTPLKHIGSPEDVAKAVLFLVRDAHFTTGSVIPVDGGRLIG